MTKEAIAAVLEAYDLDLDLDAAWQGHRPDIEDRLEAFLIPQDGDGLIRVSARDLCARVCELFPVLA